MATHGSLPPPNQPHPLRQLLSSLWTTDKAPRSRNVSREISKLT